MTARPVIVGSVPPDKGLAELGAQAQTMIDDLLWWTKALKAARHA
jgi:hypothetical protein